MYAICNLSIVPVRRESSDKSEMVSQLLFGETVEIIDKHESWRKIKIIHDDYFGWVDKKQIVELNEDDFFKISTTPKNLSSDLVQIVIWNKSQICPVVIGSSLPLYSDHKFYISKTEYAFDGNVINCDNPNHVRIPEQAYMYLNSPYLWGGRSPFGIDCSGLTQMVFKLCGINIKRDVIQQVEQGTTVNLLEESIPGDLAFFENADGKIIHVGIILQGNNIIHASGFVRIDKLDHQGIFNETTKSYTHNLRTIKRIG